MKGSLFQNHPGERSPILVTGGHRTATTWVGKTLALSGHLAYISEPLNVWHRPGVLRAPVRHWYTYICQENEGDYLPALRQTLALRYHWWDELRSLRSSRDALRMLRDGAIFLRGRLLRQRPLLKDPFAVFSIPWFVERLGFQVVVTLRHPAAFVSSLKRLDWPFQLEDLLHQPLLMSHWLEPFRSEMEALPPEDVLGRGALLWKMIYHVVGQYRQKVPGLLLVRHEDLSLQPLQGFRDLYKALGLTYTAAVERAIVRLTRAENPKEVSTNSIHSVRLDSRANLYHWKRRLSPAEVERVRAITAEVADQYYPQASWE